ncbi:GNAT family N-acetyltransferase [Brevibacillus brevis]|uniref:GNAT family N-acetyltransferase n=2 Tax=Brevibacillus brevis TaxID=1393 RepID=UPI001FD0A36F|nr:GNAT family N-acetyltransferase [Brevibacillus brevis]
MMIKNRGVHFMYFIPFTDELISEAGQLLSNRHRLDREILSVLPIECEEENYATTAVKTIWSKPNSSGVAAIEDGKLVGYLIGQKIENPLRDRHVWINLEGHAISRNTSVELYRDLYSEASQLWVDEGYFSHFALIPASQPELLHSWFRLGFGFEQTHALLSLLDRESPLPLSIPDVEIRLASPEDRSLVEDIANMIRTHQNKAPVFGYSLRDDPQELRKGYAGLLDDHDVDFWIALKDGKIVSFQGYFPLDTSNVNLNVPDRCVELGVAGTLDQFRGQGINYALTLHGLAHAKKKGYVYCMTDWRETNLQSSRYWPRQGFLPVSYRVSRLIDSRITSVKE